MHKLQPNLDLAKRKLLENKDMFLENNLKLIQGQSSKVRTFASKGLASLAAVEVSSKFKAEVVFQSQILCEDYVYNRLARMLHDQQRRHSSKELVEGEVGKNGEPLSLTRSLEKQWSEANGREGEEVGGGASKGESVAVVAADDEGTYAKSSPDQVGQVRYEKWRNRLPEVSARIQELGSKLEVAYPHLYDSLSSRLKMPLRSEVSIDKAITCIGDFIFKNSSITWYRVVAMFAIVAAMALEAIDHEDGKLIKNMITIFSQVVDRHVALWVCNQGGWAALVQTYEPITETYKFLITLMGFLVSFSLLMAFPITLI